MTIFALTQSGKIFFPLLRYQLAQFIKIGDNLFLFPIQNIRCLCLEIDGIITVVCHLSVDKLNICIACFQTSSTIRNGRLIHDQCATSGARDASCKVLDECILKYALCITWKQKQNRFFYIKIFDKNLI